MPTEIRAPRISSNDMAPSQPIAGEKIEAGHGEEAEPDEDEQKVKHVGLLAGAALRPAEGALAGGEELCTRT